MVLLCETLVEKVEVSKTKRSILANFQISIRDMLMRISTTNLRVSACIYHSVDPNTSNEATPN